MFIEEKRYNADLTYSQKQTFNMLNEAVLFSDQKYCGFYILKFQNTSPDDGAIRIRQIADARSKPITHDELIQFLQFKLRIEDLK